MLTRKNDLVVSATSNVRWASVTQAGRVGVQLISVVVFSRLLTPADYGLMALATVVTNFANLFRDMGTSAALIQREDLTAELLDSVFWLNVLLGIIVSVFTAMAAPVAAWTFSTDALMGVLLVLSVTFPITSVATAHLALLERGGEFRRIARIEVGSGVIGLVAGIALAELGAGVFSFVAQGIVTAAMSTIQLWCVSKWRPRLSWSGKELHSIWKLSGNLVIFNLVNYFVRNSDSAIVGRFIGVDSLGWYNVANRLLLFPLQNLTIVMNRAFLPVYSRRQNNLAEIASLYLRTLSLIAAVSAPMMFGLWAVREPFVAVILGPKWVPVVPILAWFAPMGFFQSLNATTGIILLAIGRTDILRTTGILSAAVLLSSFAIGLQFGLIGLITAYFAATVVVTLGNMYVTLGRLNCALHAFVRAIAAPSLCGIAMAMIVSELERYFHSTSSDIIRLLVLVPIGATIYGGLLFVFSRSLVQELSHAIRH